ncbi:hypothetical protein SLE2022_206170 [Rubroshorea leprosula]
MDGGGSNLKVVEESSRPKVRFSHAGLRILALALTLVASIVAGVDKETKVLSVPLIKTLPPVQVPVTAKWQYLSAFVYFVLANAIACSYAATSLIFLMVAGRSFRHSTSSLALVMLDLIITVFLFSAEGAAIGVGLIGRDGNSHVRWNKVCNVFEGFCRHMTAAVILSLLGSFVFLWLLVLSIVNLHKKSMETEGKN